MNLEELSFKDLPELVERLRNAGVKSISITDEKLDIVLIDAPVVRAAVNLPTEYSDGTADTEGQPTKPDLYTKLGVKDFA